MSKHVFSSSVILPTLIWKGHLQDATENRAQGEYVCGASTSEVRIYIYFLPFNTFLSILPLFNISFSTSSLSALMVSSPFLVSYHALICLSCLSFKIISYCFATLKVTSKYFMIISVFSVFIVTTPLI